MNREVFIEQLETTDSTVNMKWIFDVLKKSVESNFYDGNPRGHRNLIIVMEELAELSKEISKELRGKGDNINILEELADVQLGIYYVQEICKITNEELNKAMNIKTKRLEDVLKANTKFKTIKEKGGLEEDGYMQLTSNMGADYEAAFGDIFDVTLTGVIDRDVEEKGEGDKKKRYSTGTVRKLYFRETPLIDAGGRFAFGAVPEYMVFDKEDMGAEFVRVIEEGMEKSKTTLGKKTTVAPKKEAKKPEPTLVVEDELDDDLEDEVVETVEETASDYPENLVEVIRTMFKECKDTDTKATVKGIIAEYGKLNDVDEDGLKKIYDILN